MQPDKRRRQITHTTSLIKEWQIENIKLYMLEKLP